MEKLRFYNFGPKLYNKLIISYPQLSSLMFQLNNNVMENQRRSNNNDNMINFNMVNNMQNNQMMFNAKNNNQMSNNNMLGFNPKYYK